MHNDVAPLECGVEILTRSPRPMIRAAAYEALGGELVRRGRHRDGAEALDRAREIYRNVGATGPLTAPQHVAR